MLADKHQIHMIGVGGSGMNALAKVLVEAGYQVSGSDLNRSKVTEALAAIGVEMHIGHRAENVGGADLVVISSAIPAENPELIAAHALAVPVVKRAELLGELTRRQRSILIAGTHGKTTTSSMISLLLERAGLDPTMLVGGEMLDLGTSARLGHGQFLVAEADEFDATFLKLSPWMAVITNVEADHLDFYQNIEAIEEAFAQFADRVPADGYIVACWDDERARKLLSHHSGKVIGYGLAGMIGLVGATGPSEKDPPQTYWQAVHIRPNGLGGNDFAVERDGLSYGRFSLRVPGRHNVANALATIVAGSIVGVDQARMADVLAEFRGAARRFELKGAAAGIVIYDDYAHHPTEIAATIRGARERHSGRIWAIFQPHTYNRTKNLLADFARALELADVIIVTDIYTPAGREVDTLGVSASDIVKLMNHPQVEYIPSLEEATARVLSEARAGDMVLTMGAGNVNTVGQAVLDGLRAK